jgi:D-alanyl-D-alanine endopeptidase (penicillin-binding protein 7)
MKFNYVRLACFAGLIATAAMVTMATSWADEVSRLHKSSVSITGERAIDAKLEAALQDKSPVLLARSALVLDQASGRALFEKNSKDVLSIASITKLMSAIVIVESGADLSEMITLGEEKRFAGKSLRSRLRKDTELSRYDLLRLALMSSENKAISTLAKNHPGGLERFVETMNAKAKELGMRDSHFLEPTGILSGNISTASDVAILISAAEKFPLIRELSTEEAYTLETQKSSLHYSNTNRLIHDPTWDIVVQKTGTTTKAGKCVAFQAIIAGRDVIVVLLNGKSKQSRVKDASKLRQWMEHDLVMSALN